MACIKLILMCPVISIIYDSAAYLIKPHMQLELEKNASIVN